MKNLLNFPLSNREKEYLLKQGKVYWPKGKEYLPAGPELLKNRWEGSFETTLVPLPDWASDLGVGNPPAMLVYAHRIKVGEGPKYLLCDWWGTAFDFLTGIEERIWEKQYGPIHSYAFRLKKTDSRRFERAWVNRVFLFMRRWGAREVGKNEGEVFGPLPQPRIFLTHDVDAVKKTWAIRIKQTVFNTFKALKIMSDGRLRRGFKAAAQGFRFLLSTDDYWCFDKIMDLEKQFGVRSYFNFYGGSGGWRRTPKQILMDPGYSVTDPRLQKQIRLLNNSGWFIGLHQSFDSWADREVMAAEREKLEEALGGTVTSCRQHWLRFSWARTWKAQERAGLKLDTTLGFNDRPGFRTSSALEFHPWDSAAEQAMSLRVIPLVLVDSHLYDYQSLDGQGKARLISYYVDEIRSVRGIASVIWHQRVMGKDYARREGYKELLDIIRDNFFYTLIMKCKDLI